MAVVVPAVLSADNTAEGQGRPEHFARRPEGCPELAFLPGVPCLAEWQHLVVAAVVTVAQL